MFEAALGTALCFILLFGYVGYRKVAGFAIVADIGIFITMLWLFKGTYAGAMTGIIAGLLVTIFLRGFRRFAGYDVLTLRRKEDELLPHIIWKEVRPNG